MKRRSGKISSQASRKGRRVRKQMQAARKHWIKEFFTAAPSNVQTAAYRHALPNPWLK